jgi:hypothetical protein
MVLNGKCHCGNIAFALEWEGAPPEIRLFVLRQARWRLDVQPEVHTCGSYS